MKALLCLVVLTALTVRSFAAERSAGEDAMALAVAESAFLAKFPKEEVDAQRPFRVVEKPSERSWLVAGTRTSKVPTEDGVMTALVHRTAEGMKASVMKRPLKREPNKPPGPTPPLL
jgi:hypothetical protein